MASGFSNAAFALQGCEHAIDRGDVAVNGHPIINPAHVLQPGDRVCLVINDRAIACARDALPIEVLVEDDHMAVVWKPSGVVADQRDHHTLELALPHSLKPSQVCCNKGSFLQTDLASGGWSMVIGSPLMCLFAGFQWLTGFSPLGC